MSKKNQKKPLSCDGCRWCPDPPLAMTPALRTDRESIFWEVKCLQGQRVIVRQSRTSMDPVSYMTRVGATKHGNNCPYQDAGVATRLERILTDPIGE